MVIIMKSLRFKVNFELPLRYESVIWQIYAHIKKDPSVINKKEGDKIFNKYIYQYCIDLTMDHLDLKFGDKFKEDIEIVIEPKKDKDTYLKKCQDDLEFRHDEYESVKKMTPEMLKEYEAEYQPSGVSIKEYLAIKEALD